LKWLSLVLCGMCLLTEYSTGFAVDLKAGGSAKTLLFYLEQQNQDVWINLDRLRLDFDLELFSQLQLKLIYDNELILGNELNEFQLNDAPSFLDLDHDLERNDNLLWRHAIYRAYARYFTESIDITLGRQRIAWGVARLWNPIDLFNPTNPLQLEGAEKQGVDAAKVELYLGPLSSLQAVFAPQDKVEEQSVALRYRFTLQKYDLAFMAGEFRDAEVIGGSFDGYLGDGGIRGEITYTYKSPENEFIRAVVGGDYTFANSLYLLMEYLYNGGTVSAVDWLSFQTSSAEIITRERNFLGFGLGYDITPLVRLDGYFIYDIDQKSTFVGPRLSYSVIENLDLLIGVQLFNGKLDSEFGNLINIYYTQLQWFF
jgi:hypothetical protein